MIFANTMFRAVCYRSDECQIITGGTDRKIGYWEPYNGSQIRELDGSKNASINGMDIFGRHFVTGGGDKLIKVGRMLNMVVYKRRLYVRTWYVFVGIYLHCITAVHVLPCTIK